MKRIYRYGWTIAAAAALIHVAVVAFYSAKYPSSLAFAVTIGLAIAMVLTLGILYGVFKLLPGKWRIAPTGIAVYAMVGYLIMDVMSVMG